MPKSLKMLALHVVANDLSLSRSQIVMDLRDDVAEATAPDWVWYDRKDRNCPELAGKIKLGEFGRFPTATKEFLPRMFSVDLVAAARNTLHFLTLSSSAQPVWQKGLTKTCVKRYPMFMKLQARHLDLRLLPPPDVAVVHFSHMLQSKEYQAFALSFAKGLEKLPHCSDWMFEGADGVAKAAAVAQKLWSDAYKMPYEAGDLTWPMFEEQAAKHAAGPKKERPCGRQARDLRLQVAGRSYFQNATVSRDEIDRVPVEVATVESEAKLGTLAPVVLLDQDWLQNFVAAASGRLKFADEELQAMHVDYQRYLFLTCKYEYKMEWIGFAPTPGIDLFWHSHLLRPKAYFGDVFELCGCVPHHKLLPEDARTVFVYQGEERREMRELV